MMTNQEIELLHKLQKEIFKEDGKLNRKNVNKYKQEILIITAFLDPIYEHVEMQQRFWHIKHSSLKIDYCKVCGRHPSRWHNYHKYMCCSKECSKVLLSQNNPMKKEEIKKKVEQTNIERYGVKTNFLLINNPMQNPEILKKRKKECLEKYGVEHPFQRQDIINKIRETKTENKDQYTQNSFDALEKKYGVRNPAQIHTYKEQREKFVLENAIKKYDTLGYDYIKHIDKNQHLIRCRKCNHEFSHRSNDNRRICEEIDLCPKCNPRNYNISFKEKNLYEELQKQFPTETIEQTNKSEIFNPNTSYPLELDIYFPKYKLAIEFNGTVYHADPRFYSANDKIEKQTAQEIWDHDKLKSNLCEQKGIKLITIWEYDWQNKTQRNIIFRAIRTYIESFKNKNFNVIHDIESLFRQNDIKYDLIDNMFFVNHFRIEICNFNDYNVSLIGHNFFLKRANHINNSGQRYIQIWEDQYSQNIEKYHCYLLNQILNNKEIVYARNCIISVIDNKLGYSFQEQYHLQGSIPTTITYGLYHKDNLISVMSFKKINKIFNKWEISRYVNKDNYTVVGGAEKIWKRFLEDNNPSECITYSDKSLFSGSIYSMLKGMVQLPDTEVGYNYVDQNSVRISRQQCKISKLHKIYPQYSSLTESEIIKELGYKEIENCGNYKFVYKK